MTVSDQYTPLAYTGDGVTTQFAFPWTVASEAAVYVVVSGILVDKGDYTTHPNSDQSANPGGYIEMATAPDVGAIVVLGRNTLRTQELNLPPYTQFPSEAMESALDRLTLIVQELSDYIDYLHSEGRYKG
jgi:hypothetical protein